MAQKPLQLVNGVLTQVEGQTSSAGVADAGKMVALNNQGKVDLTMLPTGIGPDTALLVASENISAGDYINIWNDTGTPKVRLADNSNNRPAHGFVLNAFTTGQNALIYFEGGNSGLSGLTPGARYYLDTAGNATSTPPVSPGAQISQFLGIAINTTTINTDIDDEVILA